MVKKSRKRNNRTRWLPFPLYTPTDDDDLCPVENYFLYRGFKIFQCNGRWMYYSYNPYEDD